MAPSDQHELEICARCSRTREVYQAMKQTAADQELGEALNALTKACQASAPSMKMIGRAVGKQREGAADKEFDEALRVAEAYNESPLELRPMAEWSEEHMPSWDELEEEGARLKKKVAESPLWDMAEAEAERRDYILKIRNWRSGREEEAGAVVMGEAEADRYRALVEDEEKTMTVSHVVPAEQNERLRGIMGWPPEGFVGHWKFDDDE